MNEKTKQTHLSCGGRTLSFRAWSREYNLPPGVLSRRLRVGWDPIRALKTPVGARCPREAPPQQDPETTSPAAERQFLVTMAKQDAEAGLQVLRALRFCKNVEEAPKAGFNMAAQELRLEMRYRDMMLKEIIQHWDEKMKEAAQLQNFHEALVCRVSLQALQALLELFMERS